MINKDNNAYKTIGEVAKELNLRSKNREGIRRYCKNRCGRGLQN